MEAQHSPVSSVLLCDDQTPVPPGWLRKVIPRTGKGSTQKKVDLVYIAPDGEEVKTKTQLQRYLKAHPGGPAISEFNWSSGETPRRSSRLTSKLTTENINLDATRKRSRQCFAEILKDTNQDLIDTVHSPSRRTRGHIESSMVKNVDVIQTEVEKGTAVKDETMQDAGLAVGIEEVQNGEVEGELYMCVPDANQNEAANGRGEEVGVEEIFADTKDAEAEALIGSIAAKKEAILVATEEDLFPSDDGIIEIEGKETATEVNVSASAVVVESAVFEGEKVMKDVEREFSLQINDVSEESGMIDLEAKDKSGVHAEELETDDSKCWEKIKNVETEKVEMVDNIEPEFKTGNAKEPAQEAEISKQTDVGEPLESLNPENAPFTLELKDFCTVQELVEAEEKVAEIVQEIVVKEDNCLQHNASFFYTGMSTAQDKIISQSEFCAPASIGVTN